MITVNHVVEAVMSYYADGTLPPIGTPKRIVLVDGRLKVLEDNEPTPPQHQSALVEALSTADPQLLIKTDGMMTIEAHLSSK
jgi:hypothetical protein